MAVGLCMCSPVGRVAARELFKQGIVSDGGAPCPQTDSYDKVMRFGKNIAAEPWPEPYPII